MHCAAAFHYLWLPYLDAAAIHQDAVQGLDGQLGGFQDFVLDTAVRLQKNQECFALLSRLKLLEKGLGKGLERQ